MPDLSHESGRRLRWGVLGVAKIGRGAFIPGVQGFAERSEITAIGSRNLDGAQSVAAELDIPKAYGSYDDLLASDVDALYIPLPNHMHAEWTMRAADAGKHVLCEKPLALTAAQAREMAEHCEKAGVKLQEGFMYRFHPQWARVKELVDSGAIGELRAVLGWFSYFNRNPDNIRNILEYGGGAVMDIGCYPISVARLLFGAEPDGVHAEVHRDVDFGTDILTSAVLRFGTAQAAFTCSTQIAADQRVHIYGTNGKIDVEIPFNTPNDRETRIFVTERDGDTRTETFPACDQYALQADAFAAAVLDDTEVPLPPSDAIANMAVIDRVLAAG